MPNIVVGVTGGIAAYKAVTLVRLLQQAGHDVRVVPTANSLHMVGAATWQAISGHRVHTSVFEDSTGAEHVRLGQWADLLAVVPATADLLARARQGRADDLLTATLLMARCPLVFAPAMHTEMWEHPATRENVAVLRERGVHIIEPESGPLAGGDSGPGRLPEPGALAEQLTAHLGTVSGPLSGVRLLVTAGGTHEPLDPVRYIANRSTGRQGLAIALAAQRQGGVVTLLAANVATQLLERARAAGVSIYEVSSAAEMADAVNAQAPTSDVVVMAAAIADYRPERVSDSKLKKSGNQGRTILLEQTTDILRGLTQSRAPGQLIVGFAAETGDGVASARELAVAKAQAKGADLLVFNEVGEKRGFGDVPNSIVILDRAGAEVAMAAGSKEEVANMIVRTIVSALATRLPA